ncbi:4'-phosphopantetheinyl transferase family protein [Streptomyces sp. NPDC057148]|uniref:4'-phosphopantetheinyl transferase family protein n=1 Tax=unclassified Streptomyces TaxID=2593676 RepID=UPI003642AA89
MTGREAHLWQLRPGDVRGTAIPGLYLSFLSEAERGRLSRFRFPRDRDAFLLAHGLKRAALSTLFPHVAPSAWRFTTGPFGKPEAVGPGERLAVRFSITHTDGLVAVLTAPGVDCGVDAEPVRRPRDVAPLIRTTLTPPERARLEALPPQARAEHFCGLWTLKEAYAKARGLGLRLPFDRIGFRTGEDGRIHAHFGPGMDDRTDRWTFARWTVDRRHVVSAALRRDQHGEVRIVRQTAPPVPKSPAGPSDPAALEVAHYCADGPMGAAYRRITD